MTRGETGQAFTGTIAVSGGTGVYSNLVVTGLPAGLTATLGGNTITVSGTPTVTGAFSLTISVQDSLSATGTTTTAVTIGSETPTRFAIGSVTGGLVSVIDNGRPTILDAAPYPGFQGGLAVAVGDINGNGVQDVAVVVASGGPALVTVYDGTTFTPILSFFAFPVSYTGGATIALADLYGTGHEEIIVGQSTGGSAVAVYDGQTGALITAFFAYPQAPVGVTVAAGNLNGTGKAQIVTTPVAPVPLVRVFNGDGTLASEFLAFSPQLGDLGTTVAVGDLNGDGLDEILVGANVGGHDYALVYNEDEALETILSVPNAPNRITGPRLAVADIFGNDQFDLLFTAGPSLGAYGLPEFNLLGTTPLYPYTFGGAYIGWPEGRLPCGRPFRTALTFRCLWSGTGFRGTHSFPSVDERPPVLHERYLWESCESLSQPTQPA